MRTSLATLIVYAILLAILAWKVAAPFWPYLLLGFLIATIAYPAQGWLRARKFNENAARWTTLVAAMLILILPLSLLAFKLVADTTAFVQQLNVNEVAGTIEQLALWGHENIGYPQDLNDTRPEVIAAQIVGPARAWLTAWLPGALATATFFIVGIVITIMVAYYGLKDGPRLIELIKRASPLEDELEDRIFDEARNIMEGVVLGQVVAAGLQGALGYLAFLVAGIPNPLFWGFVMAILSFLPLVGAFLVWAPAALYLFIMGDSGLALGMVLWGIIIISNVDNLVKPMIVGQRGQLHPVLAFIGVIGGIVSFGVMGFVVGPLVLSLASAVFMVLTEVEWPREL